jgi:hypothetical protein
LKIAILRIHRQQKAASTVEEAAVMASLTSTAVRPVMMATTQTMTAVEITARGQLAVTVLCAWTAPPTNQTMRLVMTGTWSRVMAAAAIALGLRSPMFGRHPIPPAQPSETALRDAGEPALML